MTMVLYKAVEACLREQDNVNIAGLDDLHAGRELRRVFAETTVATDAERQAAVDEYGSDEIEIDDEAFTSHADDGYWVSAWVWVSANEAG